jgi:hypothetical protein
LRPQPDALPLATTSRAERVEEVDMIRWLAWTAGTLAAAVLWAVTAMAQQAPQHPTCDPVTHEFQASKEILADLKPGDRIDAKLRSC